MYHKSFGIRNIKLGRRNRIIKRSVADPGWASPIRYTDKKRDPHEPVLFRTLIFTKKVILKGHRYLKHLPRFFPNVPISLLSSFSMWRNCSSTSARLRESLDLLLPSSSSPEESSPETDISWSSSSCSCSRRRALITFAPLSVIRYLAKYVQFSLQNIETEQEPRNRDSRQPEMHRQRHRAQDDKKAGSQDQDMKF